MERFFVLDKYNTYYDWGLIVTAKSITPPSPNTKLVNIDGMSGTLDLSESLTGEITYADRTITASFWTSNGSYQERERLLRSIVTALHGKKIKIIEPDDTDHYFYGRVKVKSQKNILPYAEILLEITCDPWRYSINDSVRRVEVNGQTINVVINNNGVKTLNPELKVTGSVDIAFNNVNVSLTEGNYKISDLRLYAGVNIISVSGDGVVTIKFKEADR